MFQFKSKPPEVVAAVDLGSNSFHMIVARFVDGQLVVVDRLRDAVRLAAGLDRRRRLNVDVQARGISALERFGQRLRAVPANGVRVVGTNTLRSAANAEEFIAAAEGALGHSIEVISGLEEARLIYLGVAHSLAVGDDSRRLVMDIGGGSTELIIGERFEPVTLESMHMGCVSVSQKFFGDGSLGKKRFNKARNFAGAELEPHQGRFRALSWEDAIGASGTIRAVHNVVHLAKKGQGGITRASLEWLIDTMIRAGDLSQLKLPGLDVERAPVFPGGVCILLSAFEALGIERMRVADGALREGLLYDLVGRIRHEDVRERSIAALAERYHADAAQAQRVRETALQCLQSVAPTWGLEDERWEMLLGWAALLHEIGLDIAHSKYHKHGAYIVENADLPGFSRQEQRLLALLVRLHRRRIPGSAFKELRARFTQTLTRLVALLRLSVVLHRARSDVSLPEFAIEVDGADLSINFPGGWLDQHPLTWTDLEQEASYLGERGIRLHFA
jgi:exopolyphosphatase/guanosine-5'-triphosphate,3'-diphosphate pyrophosphatase